jgi:hypothetical protein
LEQVLLCHQATLLRLEQMFLAQELFKVRKQLPLLEKELADV